MTETPPETQPETPPETPPEAPQTMDTSGEGADALTYTDHHDYSQHLYQQPPWIIDAVYQANNLDRNEMLPRGTISSLIDSMMSAQDARYANEGETP